MKSAAPVWLLLRSMMSGTRVVASSTGIRFPEDNDSIDWGFVAVLIMVWAHFFPTPSDVRTAFSPSIQGLNRVSEKATNEIVAFLAEPPRIALEPDQVVIPTFPFGQMVVSAPVGWHIAGASQTNSALTTK